MLLPTVPQWSIRTSSKSFGALLLPLTLFPLIDEPEKRPLKEFLIKFSTLNGQRPLTLYFHTFCSSTGLDYNNGALSKKRKQPKPKRPPTKTKESPPKPTKGSEQSHLVSSGTVPDPQDLERDIQLASTGLPSTLDEGTHQLKPFPEGTATHPKDPEGNKQPLDRDITSTTSNEGTAKTMPRTGAKYQVDETQSTRLRYRSLTKNKDKTSSEVEPDTEPLKLQTYDDIQAFLLSDDELDKDSDEEEVLAVGDDMDEDHQDDKEVKTPLPNQDQPEPSHVQESASDSSSPNLKKFDNILPLTERQLIKYLKKMSRVLFNRITEKQWEQHEEAAVSYANLKASVGQYYDENIAHRDQTDKLVEASMSSLDRSSTTISDFYKGLNVITQLLKDISNAVKDDPVTNQKINEATETFTRISSNVIEVLCLVKGFYFSTLLSAVKSLRDHAVKQEESTTAGIKKDTSKIKSMMTEKYAAFQGHPSSAPSGSVTPILALTDIQANVEGENANTTAIEEPPSHTEGETEEPRLEIPISSILSTIDKGKGIATESDDDPSKKLVKASSIVRPDPDEPVRDKEEQIKKAKEEARLLAITKPEVIKVVQEEAEKIGLDPKAIKGAKAGEMFKKAQDAEHAVLKRQHTEKVRKSLELRKHNRRYERLKKISKELGIHSAFPLPAPEQASSRSSRKKRKHMELEPETRIPGLECNRTLPENVSFVNNMVIKEPEHGIFFTDEFGDQAFSLMELITTNEDESSCSI
ncbi:hypothetical protein Tco_0446241 [Tanacetum coccineum]